MRVVERDRKDERDESGDQDQDGHPPHAPCPRARRTGAAMQRHVLTRMAKVLVCDMNATARVAVNSTACRCRNRPSVGPGDDGQRHHRDRLRERVREIADGEDPEFEREQLIEDDSERGRPRVGPVPANRNVKRRSGDRVNRQRDDSSRFMSAAPRATNRSKNAANR